MVLYSYKQGQPTAKTSTLDVEQRVSSYIDEFIKRPIKIEFGLFAAMVVTLGWAPPVLAESFRCDSNLISEGDTALELKADCGTPDRVSVRTRLVAQGFVGPQASTLVRPQRRGGGATIVTGPPVRSVRYTREQVQTWLYLGDKQDFARVIVIARGKVESIQSLGPLDLSEDPKCKRGRFDSNTLDLVVEVACGAPDDRSAWEEEQEILVGGFLEKRRIQRERWIYNPGRGRLLRVLEFEDGQLKDVKTGGRAP